MNSAFQPMSFQQDVFRELKAMAQDFFDYDWHHLLICPRQNPLISGSTGTGKSMLVQCLARDMQLPITCLEFSAWIVTGAGSRRGAAHTLTSLYHFISTQDRGIIFVDEIEKLGSSDVESDWGKAVQLELFSVLDKRILAGVTDADDDQPRTVPFSIRAPHLERKFQASFFVVGAGAWQALWDRKIDIGFSADDRSRRTRLTYRELGKILRPEIRNRFNSSVLWLPPLTLSDYEILLREAIDRLPAEFTPIMTERAAETIVEAAETKKGFRWIQELVAFAVRELRARQATNLTSLLTS